jgi:hypothetical protein
MPEYQRPGRERFGGRLRTMKGETLRLRAAGVNRGGYAKAAAPVLCQAEVPPGVTSHIRTFSLTSWDIHGVICRFACE